MDTVLGWAGMVFLILLGPVTLAYTYQHAKKEGWIQHDWKHFIAAALGTHPSVYPGAGLHSHEPVSDGDASDAS